MTTPKSKLLGDDKPGEPARDITDAATARDATTSEGSPATTRQPVASDDPSFSALPEQVSLREHLLRIELEQCDAIVTVGSEQGHGRVWCVAGNVIDAEWRQRDTHSAARGEEAVLQILTLREGDVSVALVPVNRPRLIALSTRELLGRALRRTTRPFAAPFAELETTGVRPSVQPSQRTTLFYRPETTGVFPNASPHTSSLASKVSLNTYLAGGVALLALATTLLGIRQLTSGRNSEAAGGEQVHVGTLKASPAADAVLIEVLPAEAEIWLDSKHVGTGYVRQSPIQDGLVHQLRFVAPGYAPKSLFFRDLPAPGTVTLEPIAAAELNLKKAAAAAGAPLEPRPSAAPVPARPAQDAPPPTSGAKHREGLTSAPAAVVSESRRADRSSEPRASEARRQPAPVQRSEPAPQSKPPQEPDKPQVQVIEVRTPRVQVID